MLKATGLTIRETLLYIFNLVLVTGTFPDDLKLAKVTPVYNAGDKSECGNYISQFNSDLKVDNELAFLSSGSRLLKSMEA